MRPEWRRRSCSARCKHGSAGTACCPGQSGAAARVQRIAPRPPARPRAPSIAIPDLTPPRRPHCKQASRSSRLPTPSKIAWSDDTCDFRGDRGHIKARPRPRLALSCRPLARSNRRKRHACVCDRAPATPGCLVTAPLAARHRTRRCAALRPPQPPHRRPRWAASGASSPRR